MRLYTEQDGNLLHLQDRLVAVLGYGHLGRPVALNLRDSGVRVIVGNTDDSFAEQARQDRFEVYPINQAVKQANILFMAMPDEVMSSLYLEQIANYLKARDLLLFASGYTIAFNYIEPPAFVDVGLIAPRTLASRLRQSYLAREGYPSYLALHRQTTPQAQDRLMAMALGMGALRGGALEVSFAQEVLLDLFWQQAILPALHNLLLTATQVLMKEGIAPEVAMNELYLSGELGEFFQQAAHLGWIETLKSMSLTGQYGVLSRTERFQESKIQAHMEHILETIRSGDFAREWGSEYVDGYPHLQRLQAKWGQSALWRSEQEALTLLKGSL
jgi:ketol-acid reductoisomerase